MELTIHTGLAGASTKVNIDWFDENNVHYKEVLEINVLDMDKPRTIAFVLQGKVIATIDYQGVTLA